MGVWVFSSVWIWLRVLALWCNSACISLRGRALTSVVAAIESLGWWAAASPAATATLRPPPAATRWARPHLELPAHLGKLQPPEAAPASLWPTENPQKPASEHSKQKGPISSCPREPGWKKLNHQERHSSVNHRDQ